MRTAQSRVYYGVLLLRTLFALVCLVLVADHFLGGLAGLDAVGVRLHGLGLPEVSAVFWGALIAIGEGVLAVLIMAGRFFRPACVLMVVPLGLDVASQLHELSPRTVLFFILLIGIALSLAVMGTGKQVSGE